MSVVESLKQSPCFEGIGRELMIELLRDGHMRAFQRNQMLRHPEEETGYLLFVIEGRIKLVQHRSSGRDLIIDIVGPGRVLDVAVTAADDLALSISGLGQGLVVLVQRATFLERLQYHGRVAVRLVQELAREQQELMARFRELSAGSIEARLAALFLRLADEDGEEIDDGILLRMPLARQDLADLVDTTIETAIRIMSRWNREGVVITRRNGFLIPDTAVLTDFSD